MNITVYCGSSYGNNENFKKYAADLGRLIAERGHTLVFGASNVGLMGELCRAAMTSGGRTVGVVPKDIEFIARQAHPNLTEKICATNMTERKDIMRNLGEAFIALPGGLGTLDEISEILDLSHLERTKGNIIFLNIDGYYEDLKNFIEKAKECGFLKKDAMSNLIFADTVEQAMKFAEAKI